jgi:hypothetical protein
MCKDFAKGMKIYAVTLWVGAWGGVVVKALRY